MTRDEYLEACRAAAAAAQESVRDLITTIDSRPSEDGDVHPAASTAADRRAEQGAEKAAGESRVVRRPAEARSFRVPYGRR
jgi:hypothetical protein